MRLYLRSEVRRLINRAYEEGFVQGVKYQKARTSTEPPITLPKKDLPGHIEVTYVA